MALGKLDDTLWHQIPSTFDHVGTSDPRFFDRYWFAIYDPKGGAALQFTLGVYNNMNVVDGACVIVRGNRQRNLRASRELRPVFDSEVGPMQVIIEEPLERMRLRLEDESNEGHISCDLVWQAILPPEEEKPHFERIHGRIDSNYQRFNQIGSVSGWFEFGGERVEVSDWWSCRDHSWGVRPDVGGIERPVTGEQPPASESGTLFHFLFFSTEALAGHVQFMERGSDRVYLTGLLRERHGNGDDIEVVSAELDFELFEGSRAFCNTCLDIELADGRKLQINTSALCSPIRMTGLGYGGWNDGQGLGVYRGPLYIEKDIWDVSHPADVVYENGEIDTPYHRITPVTVESNYRDNDKGTGSLTFVARGNLPQYGLD